jgi:hypothetical protein
MLALGLAAATFSWWHQYRQGQRVLRLWGAAASERIRMATDCELFWLGPDNGFPPDALRINERSWAILTKRPLQGRPGFLHARQALIQDASYRWNTTPDPALGRWTHAIAFNDPPHRTCIAFDLGRGIAIDIESGRAADIRPIAAGLRRFFDEQVTAASAALQEAQ